MPNQRSNDYQRRYPLLPPSSAHQQGPRHQHAHAGAPGPGACVDLTVRRQEFTGRARMTWIDSVTILSCLHPRPHPSPQAYWVELSDKRAVSEGLRKPPELRRTFTLCTLPTLASLARQATAHLPPHLLPRSGPSRICPGRRCQCGSRSMTPHWITGCVARSPTPRATLAASGYVYYPLRLAFPLPTAFTLHNKPEQGTTPPVPAVYVVRPSHAPRPAAHAPPVRGRRQLGAVLRRDGG